MDDHMTLTVRFESRDIIAIRELSKIHNISPTKIIRISVGHMLDIKTNRKAIIEKYLANQSKAEVEKEMITKEKELADFENKLDTLNAKINKNRLTTKPSLEGQPVDEEHIKVESDLIKKKNEVKELAVEFIEGYHQATKQIKIIEENTKQELINYAETMILSEKEKEKKIRQEIKASMRRIKKKNPNKKFWQR